MKRAILFAAILISAVTVKAQTPLSLGPNQMTDTNTLHKKWFVTKQAGISTGFVGFNGGSGTFLSVPLGLQINRQITNNVYAFAGVSVAPSVFRYNSAFYQPGVYKGNSSMNVNSFGTFPMAEMGLMYINNNRTFSISGSIGVSRGSYYNNGYSPFYAPAHSPALINPKNNY